MTSPVRPRDLDIPLSGEPASWIVRQSYLKRGTYLS